MYGGLMNQKNKSIIDMLLNITGAISLIISIYLFGYKGMAAEMGAAVAGSSVLLFFANLEKFSKFGMLGITAELRQTVVEAHASLENLKDVAVPMMSSLIYILTYEGRVPEGVFGKNHDVFDSILQLKERISIKNSSIEESISNYVNHNLWQMVSSISAHICWDNFQSQYKEYETLSVREGEKMVDIKPFLDLFSRVDIDDKLRSNIEQMQNFHKKYSSFI